MQNFAHSETNIIRGFECACLCACTYYMQELTFFDVSEYPPHKKIFLFPGFCIFLGECARLDLPRQSLLLSPETADLRESVNQMNAFNQRKQSAFSFSFLSCFHFFSLISKVINFFIYYLISGQKNLINYFIKAMKEEMKLESRPDTLIHVLVSRSVAGMSTILMGNYSFFLNPN